MRVNAAMVQRGVKGLRDEGIRVPRSRDALTRGFWILDFELWKDVKAGM